MTSAIIPGTLLLKDPLGHEFTSGLPLPHGTEPQLLGALWDEIANLRVAERGL
jgi:hypothetical protein